MKGFAGRFANRNFTSVFGDRTSFRAKGLHFVPSRWVLVPGNAAALCVAGVALGDIHLRFAWQARHLVTSTFVLRGRRGTYGTGLALVARLG